MSRVNTKDAAAYLGVSHKFLALRRTTGDGPVYYKVGAKVIYDTADLDRWFESKRQANTADIPDHRPRPHTREAQWQRQRERHDIKVLSAALPKR